MTMPQKTRSQNLAYHARSQYSDSHARLAPPSRFLDAAAEHADARVTGKTRLRITLAALASLAYAAPSGCSRWTGRMTCRHPGWPGAMPLAVWSTGRPQIFGAQFHGEMRRWIRRKQYGIPTAAVLVKTLPQAVN